MVPSPHKHSAILEHLLDQAPIQVWGVDPDLNLTYLRGGALEAALDESLDSYVGGPLAAVLTPGSEWVLDRHRAALAGESQSYEVTWYDVVFWVHLEPPAPDRAAGEVAGIAVDITERAEIRERLEHLFAALGQGVVYQNARGEITDANAAAQEILGLTLDQMTGRSSVDPEWRAVKEDGAPFPGEEHPAMVALREGHVVSGVIMGVHNPAQDHRRWIRVTAVPRPGPDGTPAEVFTSFEDITSMWDAQEEVRARERRFHRLLEHASDGIAVLDEDGAVRTATASLRRLMDRSGDRLEGIRFADLLVRDDAPALGSALRALTEGRRRVVHMECRTRSDAGPRTLELRLSNALSEPAVAGIVVNARDISEEQRLHSEVTQLQKVEAVGRLASGVAHDFNNLLTSILGFAELLRDEGEVPGTDELDEIMGAALRGKELTRQLLQFTRREPREPTRFDLGRAVAQMERMLRRLVPEDRRLGIEVEEGAIVRADRGQLDQVLLNLVVNARDATPSGGRIGIQVSVEGDTVVLEVADDGMGIPEEAIPQIFEPFYTTKDAATGTGLGLSTVQGIVEQSGGSIRVESGLGVGTRFIVRLPRVEAEDPGDGEEEADAPARSRDVTGRTVVVVDDDPAVRTLMERILRSEGLRVLTANDPAEAGDLIDGEDAIDLIVSDVMLPGMRGPEFVDRVLETRPDTGVILISGYTEQELEGLNRGHRLLSKPFSRDELIQTVRSALAG